MSTKPRTIDEINNDYAHKLAELGEHQYLIGTHTREIARLMQVIDRLQAEAQRARQSMKDRGVEVALPEVTETTEPDPSASQEESTPSEVLAG